MRSHPPLVEFGKSGDPAAFATIGNGFRIIDFPFEIFMEIASRMSPNDVLNLARSSKTLRKFFMSKSSKHVWVSARKAMGIPDLDHLSEPHYADLLFNKRCHIENCGDPNAVEVSFALGIRLCRNYTQKVDLLS
ncbi:hypothetical protein SCHPADRAFT_120373 [Schizopora paradoxa]|uniref:F-box domain-containing protein n=1 Tax=Schizopora paradoxa TaxID=27342 RepID=A0A0H2S3G3_9AGAM|nr:hypothetical protein SCHPADRAFT_120373 [Schizopora paradoxa]